MIQEVLNIGALSLSVVGLLLLYRALVRSWLSRLHEESAEGSVLEKRSDYQSPILALYEIITHPGFRIVVALIITLIGLPVCFYVVLSNSKFDDTARNFAAGTIGVILGFWLKP